jgi:dTDP-4-dehydrorhamnose 3,5-epimerase
MTFERVATPIPGAYELKCALRSDTRGAFIKTFHRTWFEAHGLCSNWVEQYYSTSIRRVLRGLHFQTPPHDHDKLVYCTYGEVMDVALDLRIGSPTFGKHMTLVLSASKGNMVYLARGLAHGFYTLSEGATLVYNVSSVYSQSHDAGICWNSAGIQWPDLNPLLSERDRSLEPLSAFDSPFDYSAEVSN